MKIFACTSCGQTVFFENVRCMTCGHSLGYLPDTREMRAIEVVPETTGGTPPETRYVPLPPAGSRPVEPPPRYRLCKNSIDHGVCNWLVPEADPSPFCTSCRLNAVIPNLIASPDSLAAWARLEQAKRRLLYSLFMLNLPVANRVDDVISGLSLSFMADAAGEKVFTGHNDGIITINVAEADDPFREKTRQRLGEVYRTLLGHFRHEIGHYYFFRLVQGSAWVPVSRALFGDESADYDAALKRHYAEGAPANWTTRFISGYATMHPSEDWAETWAHYLHMVDTLNTAESYGVVVSPKPEGRLTAPPQEMRRIDATDIDALFEAWVPLSTMLNSLNRSMGVGDAYPFVLAEPVKEKIRFVHDVIHHWNSPKELVDDLLAAWAARLRSEGAASSAVASQAGSVAVDPPSEAAPPPAPSAPIPANQGASGPTP